MGVFFLILLATLNPAEKRIECYKGCLKQHEVCTGDSCQKELETCIDHCLELYPD